MKRTISREQFFEEWRAECREFLAYRGRRFGSDLLDELARCRLVVSDPEFMRSEHVAVRARKNGHVRRPVQV